MGGVVKQVGHQPQLLAPEQNRRIDILRAVLASCMPLWENREVDISDALLCARWVETGEDPYTPAEPLPSPDAMRSHP